MNNEKKSSSVDDLLANIETKYQKTENLLSNQASLLSGKSESMKSKASNSIDSCLNEIESNIKQNKQKTSDSASVKKPSKESDFDDVLAEIKAKFTQEKSVSSCASQAKSKTNVDENDLANIAKNFQAKRQQESEIKNQDKLKNIQQEELNKQRRRKQLTIKAQEWLKNLDSNSDEGFWFEQFAYSYENKLEAAIDYLEALN